MRYLIVGYGNIGHKRQAALGRKCVATVDPNPKAGADYKNYREVPLGIFDTAVLTIPQQIKTELTEYFLRQRKHVLVEKPLITSPKDGKELLALARKNKVIWYTSYNHRFEPNIQKIKTLIDKGFLGKLYHARFIYSFGNIKERLGTWRETNFGVLEEIAPHQLDFVMNFFGYKGRDFKTLIARKVESDIFDHWLIVTTDKKVSIELSAVTWKNVFSIDIYGKRGSIHMNGLNKWGGSRLSVRTRVLPSGAPIEKNSQTSGPDLTWKKDFRYFERMVLLKKTSYENDLAVSQALATVIAGSSPKSKNT
ncbi:MAG: Gfo/Idh/MocA family oxidoreductase [bacterium]|nr:Gfo/Idh/MocA family oxidoreductase [bacterium]